jgi:hypothetical protein
MCFMPTIVIPSGAPLYTRTSGLQPCYHAVTRLSIASFFKRIHASELTATHQGRAWASNMAADPLSGPVGVGASGSWQAPGRQ